MTDEIYDIAILGAGPIGLEAALRAADDSYKTIVIERCEVGQNIRDWGHVKLFSPFGMNSSERGRNHSKATASDEQPLSGREYVETYLDPLKASLDDRVVFRCQQEVFSVERLGWPKGAGLADARRAIAPFDILSWNGEQEPSLEYTRTLAKCVVDTTGSGGVEWGQIQLVPDDKSWLEKTRSCGGRVAVVGTGATAATNVVALTQHEIPFTWFTRNTSDRPISELHNDPLQGRRELFQQANEAVESEFCERVSGRTFVRAIDTLDDHVAVETVRDDGVFSQDNFAHAFVNTGLSPDMSFIQELHVHLCYATEGPIKLAAKLLGETGGDCLTQSGSDASLLVNPEPNFFILGAKSYGRNSNFLIRAGIEQVDAVFDELLPETLWPLIGRKGRGSRGEDREHVG